MARDAAITLSFGRGPNSKAAARSVADNTAKLTLHAHPLASYCWKVLIALYESGTPFAFEFVKGQPSEQDAFREFWPIGKMPLLRDAARARAIPETSIIIEYLQQHYPGQIRLIPSDPGLQLEVRLWDRFFDLYVQTPMQKSVGDQMREAAARDASGVAEAKAMLDTAYGMLDARMKDRCWMAGEEFTMADCSAAPALFYAQTVRPFVGARPELARYFERLVERPSVSRTIGEARPYFSLFPLHAALDPRFTSTN